MAERKSGEAAAVAEPKVPQYTLIGKDGQREKRPARVSTWRGHRSYHCETCPLGTLSRTEIEQHVCRPVRKETN